MYTLANSFYLRSLWSWPYATEACKEFILTQVFGKACYLSWLSYSLTINTDCISQDLCHYSSLRTYLTVLWPQRCLPIIFNLLLLLLLLFFFYYYLSCPRIFNYDKRRKTLTGHYKGREAVTEYPTRRHFTFSSLAASGSPQQRAAFSLASKHPRWMKHYNSFR
jgi:hypothetical protein